MAGLWAWLGVGLTFLGVVLALGWYLMQQAVYPRTRTLEESYEEVVTSGLLDPVAFERLPREEVRIRSPHGYELFGLYIPAPSQAAARAKTVIIVHGITQTLYWSVRYLWPFRKRGFNALLIEQRHHGRSGGPNITYGYYEKDDLRAWVDWVLERCGETCVVGTHGESLGGATVLQHAAHDPRLAFAVADCPYAVAWDELAYRLRVEYRMPPFPILHVANLLTGLLARFSFKEANALAGMAELQTPVLFIHGLEDDYIPPQASVALHAAKPEPKRLWLAPNARHAEALPRNPERYDEVIGEFLASLGLAGGQGQ